MVAGDDFDRLAGAVIKHDEVLKEIEKIAFYADAFQQGFHSHHARLIFVQAFPFVKIFILAGKRADFGVNAVCQHDHGVMVEQMRDGIFVIGQILLVRGAGVFIQGFEFHEQQRQAVDKADQIGPAAIGRPPHPQFPCRQKMVLARLLKVEDPQAAFDEFAVGAAKLHLHAVFEERVFLLIDLQGRLGKRIVRDLPDRLLIRLLW